MFELLEKYLMGPMGKVATYRPVRAIVAGPVAGQPAGCRTTANRQVRSEATA